MKQISKLALAAVMALGTATAFAQWQRPDPRANVGLKDAYKDYFAIGVALNQRNVSDEAQTALVRK